jgi:hypothetical protein
VTREGQRALAIAADGEPEFGGMVGERILVLREQFVVAGCRLAAPGLSRLGLAGAAQDSDGRFAAEPATTALLTMSATA